MRRFTREETAAAATGGGDSFLPPREAIARRLVESWLDGTAGSA